VVKPAVTDGSMTLKNRNGPFAVFWSRYFGKINEYLNLNHVIIQWLWYVLVILCLKKRTEKSLMDLSQKTWRKMHLI